MNVEETLLDLLYKKAVHGLDDAEERQLEELQRTVPSEVDIESIEMTAGALSVAGMDISEQMPPNLRSRVLADAERYFDERETQPRNVRPAAVPAAVKEPKSAGSGIWGWLGWAAAAAACIALAVNIYITRSATEIAGSGGWPTPVPEDRLTPEQMREQLIGTAPDLVRATWYSTDKDTPNQISGDVVWSDAKQAGYVRLSGLPKNDPAKETYQLWIFDETQSEKTPISGGVFDITSDGEVIIQIDASLRAKKPRMFAITLEKPGGVMVAQGKVAALAKLET